MARKVQISQDIILKAALNMIIEEGYSSITIKTLSQKIGCSTQPIVWHFGNMNGLRTEVAKFALNYANERMRSTAKGMDAFINLGIAYVELAFDEPHLFRYLYMSGDSGYFAGDFDVFTAADENAAMAEQIAAESKIPIAKVNVFYRNMMIYTHGLASFIVSGLIKSTKDEIRQMMSVFSEELLLLAVVSGKKNNTIIKR